MIALLPLRVVHPSPCGAQRFVFLAHVEVDGATRVLRRRAQRPGDAGSTIRATEASMDARASVLAARDAPGHGGLALRTGHLFVLPVDGKSRHVVSLAHAGLPARYAP